ncbi:MAG: DUF1772 domain-containing protein [Pyrinomonadaceae bacterium]
MKQQLSVPHLILFVFVIMLGLEIGAGLYEALVVLPLWNTALPESVIAYYHHNALDPQFALNAGGRFWMFFTPLTGLLSLATLLSGLKTDPPHRKWRLIGAAIVLTVVICTFVWFVPNIIRLMGPDVVTMGSDQVASLATWWVRLNWVRAVLYLIGLVASVRALTIPTRSAK